jgi:hypothetical protein
MHERHEGVRRGRSMLRPYDFVIFVSFVVKAIFSLRPRYVRTGS